jgi:hypothetical protein
VLGAQAFYQTYRMHAEDFDELHELISRRPVLQAWRSKQTGTNTSTDALLAACIEHLATGATFVELRRSYAVSSSRLHDAMQVVLVAIVEAIKADERYSIRMPRGEEVDAECARWSQPDARGADFSFLAGAMGACDGSLIPLQPRLSSDLLFVGDDPNDRRAYIRAESARPWRCRKGAYAVFVFLFA